MRFLLHLLLRAAFLVADLVRACRTGRDDLILENLALRQQLANLKRLADKHGRRVTAEPFDRMFWSVLARLWAPWRRVLAIVKPETVIAWHRDAWRAHWAEVSRRVGRPPIQGELAELVARLHRENPKWAPRRIVRELKFLGHSVHNTTVRRFLARIDPPEPSTRKRKERSQSWKVFLKNHLEGTISIDFFTVATATLDVIYGFVVLSHERRKILHVHAADSPGALWALRQVREAVAAAGDRVRCLIRDRDCTYGKLFADGMRVDGITEHVIAARCPWQNGLCERVIGTLRRELLDHVIVLGDTHLLRLLTQFKRYYNADRPHSSLDDEPPDKRVVETPAAGKVVSLPRVGGLHHRYERRAA